MKKNIYLYFVIILILLIIEPINKTMFNINIIIKNNILQNKYE